MNRATRLFDDLVRYRETEACACADRFRCVEGIENVVDRLRWHANSLIVHFDKRLPVKVLGGNGYAGFCERRARLRCIDEEIYEHLLEPKWIG